MTITDYLSKFEIDKFRIYYREVNRFDYIFTDKSNTSELLRVQDNMTINNSILNSKGEINETYELIVRSSNISELENLIQVDSNNVFPNRKNSFFDIAIIIENKEEIIGGLNVDFRNRLAKSIENQILYVSSESIDELAALYKRYNCQITKYYLPPSIPINNHWTNYHFPSNFFYNPAFELYEATINTGLMCLNFEHARIEISPVGTKVSVQQIKRVQQMESNRFEINKFLINKFWESYNYVKEDYELPYLNKKEQLYFFVKTSSIIVPIEENEPITIFFRTWDDEHGQTVYYYDKDKIEFE
ncbi:hypothetical protein [Flavivirga algicola]|uniref:Uncharacterized protein n=1 Tax=Flavivirga algicola TaxID=2729136 RepID=A0ABX1S147_9FLAO|nr:hypothetical protein [Flavivirga algicola]NMH89609.1 hypothetical protein [Flavivirga algicola]